MAEPVLHCYKLILSTFISVFVIKSCQGNYQIDPNTIFRQGKGNWISAMDEVEYRAVYTTVCTSC